MLKKNPVPVLAIRIQRSFNREQLVDRDPTQVKELREPV